LFRFLKFFKDPRKITLIKKSASLEVSEIDFFLSSYETPVLSALTFEVEFHRMIFNSFMMIWLRYDRL